MTKGSGHNRLLTGPPWWGRWAIGYGPLTWVIIRIIWLANRIISAYNMLLRPHFVVVEPHKHRLQKDACCRPGAIHHNREPTYPMNRVFLFLTGHDTAPGANCPGRSKATVCQGYVQSTWGPPALTETFQRVAVARPPRRK